MEKIFEAGQKVIFSFKNTVEKHTTFMMHVGQGAVVPKRVFRYPSPGAQDNNPTEHQRAIHLPSKAEDLGHTRRVDRYCVRKCVLTCAEKSKPRFLK